MSGTFDERSKGMETKYARDEEFRFKVNAKAVRLFGLWVAGQIGKSGAEAEAYADEVVDADFDEPGIQDVLRKVKKDFTALSDHQLEAQFNTHLEEAKKTMG